ncbi:MAG: PAS domain S-box protein [Gemmatimonadales bacterium]
MPVIVLSSLLTAALAGWLVRFRLTALTVPRELSRMRGHAEGLARSVDAYLTRSREVVVGTAGFPEVAEVIAAPRGPARERLAQIFRAQLTARAWLLQLRLLDAQGQELVRAERSSGAVDIRIAPDSLLQDKGDRPYFREGLTAPAGEALVSPIEPNQEFGRYQEPVVPVFRAVAAVRAADGPAAGVIVANVDAKPLFAGLTSPLYQSSQVYLVSGTGEFVANRLRPETLFERTLAGDTTSRPWPEAFPAESPFRRLTEAGGLTGRGDDALGVVAVPTALRPAVVVVESASLADLNAAARSVDGVSWVVAALAALGSLVAGLILTAWLGRPLDDVRRAVEAFRGNEEVAQLLPGGGNYDQLSAAVARMAVEVRDRTRALESEIEARDRIATELRAEQERTLKYQAVVEGTVDAVVTVDPDGTVTSWNRGAEELYGYPAADAVGRSIDQIVPPTRRPEAADLRRRALAGERVARHETIRLHRTGRLIDVSLSVSPIRDRDGAIVGFAKVASDLSPVQQAEARFRAVVEQTPSGVCVVGPDGRIVLVNAEMERLFGYRRDQLAGMTVDQLVPAGRRAEHRGNRAGYLAEPTSRRMGQGRDLFAVRQDGSEVAVEIGLTPINIGGQLYTLCLVADITARKAAESRVADYAARLERSNADLEQFAHVVSHDLKAPLRGIAIVADWLERDFGPVVDEDGRDNVRLMRQRVARLAGLIDGILAYSRVSRAPVANTPVAVGDLLADVVASIERPPGIAIELLGPFPEVEYDATQLRQVFQNLIVNALAHGGPDLRRVEVSSQRTGGGVRFAVRDDGVGIDPRHFGRIFDLFQTLRPKDDVRTSGVGLAIVKRIVELNGGTVTVESTPGSGTTFSFLVPPTRVLPAPALAETA